MNFEYSFDNPLINVGLVLFLWIHFLLGTYIFSKLSHKMYLSEYKKDPTFRLVPTSLRWKMIVLIFISVFLFGFPFIGGVLSVGFTTFYLVSPVLEADSFNLLGYIITLSLYIAYMMFFASKFKMLLYNFVKDSFEFEIYFRKNAKNWGLLTTGQEININENEYKKVALFGKLFIDIGLVPITIIVLTQLL